MPTQLDIVHVRSRAFLEHGQEFVLATPEATLSPIRLAPDNQVEEVKTEFPGNGEDELDTSPVNKGAKKPSLHEVSGRGGHPGLIEGTELLPAHLTVSHGKLPVVRGTRDVPRVWHVEGFVG